MPAHYSHEPLLEHTKSSLEWDEYEEAAYEMWEMAANRGLCWQTLHSMSDRLRELFPTKQP